MKLTGRSIVGFELGVGSDARHRDCTITLHKRNFQTVTKPSLVGSCKSSRHTASVWLRARSMATGVMALCFVLPGS